MTAGDQAVANAMVVVDGAWAEVRGTFYVQSKLDLPIDRLPDIGEAAVRARSERAAELLARIHQIDEAALPRELSLTLAVARITLARTAREGDLYWLAIDMLGIGFYGMFAPTAYCGGLLLGHLSGSLNRFRFDQQGDLYRYLGLVEDYGRLVTQMRLRTEGQAERGIRMPVAQLDQAIELVARQAARTRDLVPTSDRLAKVGGEAAATAIAERVAARIDPAWAELAALLGNPGYRAAAPQSVGLAQYPGGKEVYDELVAIHTTLNLTPAEVHAEGLKRVAAVRFAMEKLLTDADFAGTPDEYLKAIESDPAWRAEGAEGVAAVFRRYIDRLAPHLDDYFDFKPNASHDVAALPASLSSSMSFGYYDAPKPDRPVGLYLFNADNLSRCGLANIAALNYHELVPGHHLHFATQIENDALHPLRAHSFINAFNEGWAEYAATLAGEMGMYQAPQERFGRLIMDAFATCRLVVDTGMNALGWSLEEAREYMRANAFMPESEIRSESIRYSCDIPAQGLPYKLGEYFLVDLREAMRKAQGKRFDIRRFHEAVLRPGALPLPLVARNIDFAIAAA